MPKAAISKQQISEFSLRTQLLQKSIQFKPGISLVEMIRHQVQIEMHQSQC